MSLPRPEKDVDLKTVGFNDDRFVTRQPGDYNVTDREQQP